MRWLKLHGSEGAQIDITEYPLYQQAIKDVLSEEASARYSEYQVERAVLASTGVAGYSGWRVWIRNCFWTIHNERR